MSWANRSGRTWRIRAASRARCSKNICPNSPGAELVDGVHRIGEIDTHACAERARRFSAAPDGGRQRGGVPAALDGSGGSKSPLLLRPRRSRIHR